MNPKFSVGQSVYVPNHPYAVRVMEIYEQQDTHSYLLQDIFNATGHYYEEDLTPFRIGKGLLKELMKINTAQYVGEAA